jgi:hypothetical protein
MEKMKTKRATNIKGKNQYSDFKRGLRLTYKQAVLAHCYQCMGFFEDGKQDCCGYSCPLYQFYPYKGKNAQQGGQNSTTSGRAIG